ncbi:hypothetical protein D3C87_645690 [compost metagenome]
MSRLKELGKNKLTVLKRLISSQELCKALYYNDSNFLDKPDIPDTSDIIGNKIFPFFRIPDLTKEKTSFLTFSFRDYRSSGGKFKSGLLEFRTIIHQDLIYTDYECLRYDHILSCVDDMFNDLRGLGIGKTEFYKMDEFNVNNIYTGTYISYKIVDFN